jgi:hypothetical protein
MRKLLLIALALALVGGCKKKVTPKPTPPAGGSSTDPAVHAPTGVVLNPGMGGGGGGGAAQAVRKAVTRTVNQNELKNVQTFIETASSASGQMPSVQEVTATLQKEAPKTYKLVQDGAIVLTGTRSRENIWAYTADAQDTVGQHLVVTSSGIERMAAQTLQQRLQQQKGQ